MGSNTFWKRLDQLVTSSKIKIDRSKGSAHPRYPEFIYPFDYGFLEGAQSTDGDPLDI